MSNETVPADAPNSSEIVPEGGARFPFEGVSLTIYADRVQSCSMRNLVEILETTITIRNTLWAARDRAIFHCEKGDLTPGGSLIDDMSDWFEQLIDTIQMCVRTAKPTTSEEAKMKTYALLTYLTPLLDDLHEVSIITAEGLRDIANLEFRERRHE